MDRLDKHFRRLTKEVFSRYGFAYADVLTQWSAIVGDELGQVSAPERIRWPRPGGPAGDGARLGGTRHGGTMVLRVAEGRALEFQHLVPRIVERINGFYGYQAIAAIKVLQGEVAAPAPRALAEPRAENLRQAIGGPLDAIHDDCLRAALMRLQAAVSHGEAAPSQSVPQPGIQS